MNTPLECPQAPVSSFLIPCQPVLYSQNLNSFLFDEFFPGPLVIRELPSKVFWCQIQSLHLVRSCLISLTSQVFLFLHQVEDSWRMNNWKLSPGHNGIRMKLWSPWLTHSVRIPAPPDSSKLVPLRVRPDFLLCVPRSVGAAVRGPRSFFPPAVTVAAAPRRTRSPCRVRGSCQLCNTPRAAQRSRPSLWLLRQMWALGLPAQAFVLQRRSEGGG